MRIIFTLFLLIISTQANAQSISGRVYSQEQEAVLFAAVTLNQVQDSTLVKAVITNEQGYFEIKNVPNGTFNLNITNLGFADYQKQVQMNGTSLDLGNIVLETTAEMLDEVEVVAEKPMVQVLADKTVFNVENTINATGTSAFELLRKAPGVIIDNSGGIIVEGKAGVQFFIDGRLSVLQGEDLMNYLESLQATDIEAIEIITQPSSKYDAAGSAGIINIKLKKDKSLGTNGNITAGVTVGDFARTNGSINFNTRSKKGNLYGTYSNRFGKSTGFLNLLRTQSGTQLLARTNSIYDRNSNNLKLGYDFYATDKSTVGVIVNGNFNNSFNESNSRTPIRPVGTRVNDSVLVSDNRSSSTSYNLNGNLNYKYADTLGYSLNMDLDFGKYDSDRASTQPNIYFNGEETQIIRENATRQVTPTDISITTFRTDYEQSLFKGKLGLGFKLSNVRTNNIFDFFNRINGDFILDNTRSNTFEYTEKINAGYINYNYKWEKWNIQAGLRMENTISVGNLLSMQQNEQDQVKRNYVNWFPSGGLTYQLNRKNQFALTYSKRIQRPTYESLNPFEYVIDELYSSQGNPFLQPQYTDNIKFSHTFNYRLTTSLSYSYVSDFFARVTVPEEGNRSFITTRNVADQEIINLGISYPKKIKEWWNMYVSLNAYTSSYKANSAEFISLKQETLSMYMQHTFTLPSAITMEVSGWYSSPSVWGGTYTIKALGSLNLAFQKKFLGDKLTTRLSFNDILYTIPWQGTNQFGDLFIDGSGGSDSRQVAFSVSYDFGRDEIKKARSRKTGLEDEKDRIEN
jgi:hypothetical protein